MKKFFIFAALALVTIGVSGCSNMQVATKFSNMPLSEHSKSAPMAHLHYTNCGLYLFNWIPIFTGSVTPGNSFALFTNTVTVENAVLETTRQANNLGGNQVINLTTSTDSSYKWYSLFYWTRSVSVSATVLE